MELNVMSQGQPSPSKTQTKENVPGLKGLGEKIGSSGLKRLIFRYGLALIVVILLVFVGNYYSKFTNYPIAPISQKVTFAGKPLGIYYLDVPRSWRPTNQVTDVDGFGGFKVDGVVFRHPVIHCEMIFDTIHKYAETGSRDDADKILHLADLLVAEMKVAKLGGRDCTVLWYNFPWKPWMPSNKHWLSAMAQGFAISALCRAYEIQKKPEYVQAARACLAIFDVEVKDGGVVSHDEQGNTYYEEYAINGRAYHVLNGFIYCLLGLYDLYRTTGDVKAKSLFDQGIRTLATPGVLERYDVGFWTTYDQSPYHWPSLNYSAIHIRQLRVLYRITGLDVFKAKADKWEPYNLEHRYRLIFFFWGTWKMILVKFGAYCSS